MSEARTAPIGTDWLCPRHFRGKSCGITERKAMINGDTDYVTFIDHVNAMIERQKAISKARSTRAKKEDEEKPSL